MFSSTKVVLWVLVMVVLDTPPDTEYLLCARLIVKCFMFIIHFKKTFSSENIFVAFQNIKGYVLKRTVGTASCIRSLGQKRRILLLDYNRRSQRRLKLIIYLLKS